MATHLFFKTYINSAFFSWSINLTLILLLLLNTFSNIIILVVLSLQFSIPVLVILFFCTLIFLATRILFGGFSSNVYLRKVLTVYTPLSFQCERLRNHCPSKLPNTFFQQHDRIHKILASFNDSFQWYFF